MAGVSRQGQVTLEIVVGLVVLVTLGLGLMRWQQLLPTSLDPVNFSRVRAKPWPSNNKLIRGREIERQHLDYHKK